jgi:predicted ATP-grasp superfamily ATP-dependent carboligase
MKPLNRTCEKNSPTQGPLHGAIQPPAGMYLQQFVAGQSYSAVFQARLGRCDLLGITMQMVGAVWLHAPSYAYCGSVGPVELPEAIPTDIKRTGTLLTKAGGLRGLFGADFIVSDGAPRLVEINPRYTASIEVLEIAMGIRALSWHRDAFEPKGPVTSLPTGTSTGMLGKAILFAVKSLVFPKDGPWRWSLENSGDCLANPEFADIPAPGERIEAGQPILTFFVRGDDVDDCLEQLQARARALDRLLQPS